MCRGARAPSDLQYSSPRQVCIYLKNRLRTPPPPAIKPPFCSPQEVQERKHISRQLALTTTCYLHSERAARSVMSAKDINKKRLWACLTRHPSVCSTNTLVISFVESVARAATQRRKTTGTDDRTVRWEEPSSEFDWLMCSGQPLTSSSPAPASLSGCVSQPFLCLIAIFSPAINDPLISVYLVRISSILFRVA